MSRPRLILLDDDRAILDLGEAVTAERHEIYQRALEEAMKNRSSLVLAAGDQGWEIVDQRKPDIMKRLEKVERWIKRHDKAGTRPQA